MLKRLILKSIAAVLFIYPSLISAKGKTNIEGFIDRVKTTNSFVTVSNIWQPDQNFDQTDLLKNVTKVQPLSIDYAAVSAFLREKNTAINLVVPGPDGISYTLELARYDFITNDFEVHEVGENGVDKKVDYTPGLYYRGVVRGYPGSVVAFSFFKNEVYGIFSIANVGNFVVVPNSMVGSSYDYNTHYVCYNDNDLTIKDKAPLCMADQLPERNDFLSNPAAKTTTTLNNKEYVNCKEVRSFMVADYAMYQKKGSSSTNCTNYITSLYNNISTLYKNEGIMTVLKYVQVNTATDQYQTLPTNNSARWLTKFGWVTQTTMHGCDLAMLLTTKGGSMGGIAWLNVLCADYRPWDSGGAYAFCNIDNSSSTSVPTIPTYSWDVNASTHEMGHNLGSPHTHRCCWNPPARNTVIDACYTKEGTCANPSPLYPVGGGTIMSYCHLQSVGVNFTKGFGPQPGDTIRYTVRTSGSSCGNIYNPNAGLAVANRKVTANKECTDMSSGITYYWKDANTADHADDTLVLMIKKNGNDIGGLNDTGFSVSTTTMSGYGGGTGYSISFPAGTGGTAPAGSNYAMRRYWSLKPVGANTVSATNPVSIGFPFMGADTTDVNGSAPGATAPLSGFRTYIVKSPVSADPSAAFGSAVAADIKTNVYSTAGTGTGKWIKYPYITGSTMVAYLQTEYLGGGGMFYPVGTISLVGEAGTNSSIDIFPNPTNGDWYVTLDGIANDVVTFQLYSADGRVARTLSLQSDKMNTIPATDLPAGVYFYRVVNNGNVQTGSLMKN